MFDEAGGKAWSSLGESNALYDTRLDLGENIALSITANRLVEPVELQHPP
jgi:hypothetical protein